MRGPRVRPVAVALLLASLASSAGTVHAHEFWIEPVDFTPPADGELVATLRNGENLVAESLPWRAARFESISLAGAGGSRAIANVDGALPAIVEPLSGAGAYEIVAETRPQSLRYPDFAKFEAFTALEGMPEIAALHRDAGLPTQNIVELYTRYAKTLLRVGDEPGEAKAAPAFTGFPVEIGSLDDPYAVAPDDAAATLGFELRIADAPAADRQVAVFRRDPDGAVTREALRTDAAGRIELAAPAPGTYLLSAVDIRRPSARDMLSSGAMWESLWASLVFAVEARD